MIINTVKSLLISLAAVTVSLLILSAVALKSDDCLARLGLYAAFSIIFGALTGGAVNARLCGRGLGAGLLSGAALAAVLSLAAPIVSGGSVGFTVMLLSELAIVIAGTAGGVIFVRRAPSGGSAAGKLRRKKRLDRRMKTK